MEKDILLINAREAWKNCLNIIRSKVTEKGYRTWFEPIIPVGLENDVLRLLLPNQACYQQLEGHYVDILAEALTSVLGQNAKLEYQIEQNSKTEIHTQKIEPIKPLIKQTFDSNLNDEYTFDNFVEGDCNRMSKAAAMSIAERPGVMYNPLLVFGEVGLGKTHLVQAIGNHVKHKYPEKNVYYISSEKFISQFVDAIRENAVQSFNKFYEQIDVLIVDDVQFFSGKEKTQENFFHIFNALHIHKKAIILTSDRPPKDLKGLEDRLVSRFSSGLTVDVQLPDYETRLAILEKKITTGNEVVPHEVLQYIAQNVTTNIRELEGCLISLLARSSLEKRTIDLALAREVLINITRNKPKEASIETIQIVVAQHFDLTVEDLNGVSRKKDIATARQIAMYLCKKLTQNSYKIIGSKFGNRDHSTVVHAFQTIENLCKTDKKLKETLSLLEVQIGQR
ncbi:MAG: chromosomal replication initiator protein DnaA [Bacteroidia bacterium]|nr:chromosomal replication initiator protein DnaA [Bacteroidia bacterium]MDW8345593.1 chromosomal replication initiator protein DnaA [Bacteroidia bacterium]